MKKLIFLFSIGLIAFTSCSKEESNESIEQESSNLVQLYKMDGAQGTWETIELNGNANNIDGAAWRNHGNRASTRGVINSPSTNLEWNGTDVNGNISGSATIALGPTVMTLETECVMALGNEAVYGGVVTEITNPFGPFTVGLHIYMKVIDSNSPDQYVPGFLISPISQCGVASPDYFIWSFFGIADVQSPGQVLVRN